MANIAFIGTGLLGSAMVEGMLRRGDTVAPVGRKRCLAQEVYGDRARVLAIQ